MRKARGAEMPPGFWTDPLMYQGGSDGFLAPREPLWRVSVAATAPLLGVPGTKLVEWAGALRWLRTSAAPADVREAAHRAGGSAALWHGDGRASMFEPLPPALLAIHRRLKEGFDPAGLLNRGRLVPGL